MQLNNALKSISPDRLAETLGTDGVQKLYKISDDLSDALSTSAKQAKLAAAIKAATGKGGFLSSTAVSAELAGAASYLAHLMGASAGGTGIGIPIGVVHFLYTHPAIGEKVLAAAAKGAPVGAQAAKQAATHVYRPDTGEVEPLD